MTTEHVSVPRELVKKLEQIRDWHRAEWSFNEARGTPWDGKKHEEMGDIASAILSKAEPTILDNVSFSTVEKVVKALSRIGHTFPESQEEQAARFEMLVLDLCGEVQSHFDILSRATPSAPIPMVLHCPSCGLQHIDAPSPGWDNPPHKSHLCHGCGSVWRPADVETTGVERIESQGKNDGLKTITQTVTDTVVAAYVSAVNSHLGSLTEKDWEIERFDPVASIHRVARIGLTAAFAQSRGAVVPHGWIGEVECCDAKGMWLIMSDNCALIPGQKVRIWVDDSMAAPSAPRVVTDDRNAMRAAAFLCRAAINDDSYACSFQSMAQYRTALIAKIDGFIAELAAAPQAGERG